MKFIKMLAAVAIALAFPTSAWPAGELVDGDVLRYDTNAHLRAASPTEDKGHVFGYALDTNTTYLRSGSLWIPVDPSSPEYKIAFTEGAGKGFVSLQLDGTATDTSTGTFNIGYFSGGAAYVGSGGGRRLVYAALGAGQTANLATVAGGLDVTGDQADNEGYEIIGGVLGASGRPLIPGTDPAFQFCASITITDVSDTDDLHIGFRDVEVTNAAFANYGTYAAIGIQASAATAAIYLQTEDDGGGQTATDTTNTWADAATKALCVKVSAAGVVTYTINGSAPTATASFTFDDGEPVIPFFWWLHAGAADCVPVIDYWEVSYQ